MIHNALRGVSTPVTVALVIVVLVGGVVAGFEVGLSQHPAKTTTPPPTQAEVEAISASLYAKTIELIANQSKIPLALAAMGSVAGARQVQLEPDTYSLFISVDPSLISSILYPAVSQWYITFASDRMVIGFSNYTPDFAQVSSIAANMSAARDAGNLTAESSYTKQLLDLVFSSGAKLGISDPNTDPEGYRTLMFLQLAGTLYYDNSTHYTALLQQKNSSGQAVEETAGSALVPLLQDGQIGFDIALYGSTAISDKLDYSYMSPQIDLGESNYSSVYRTASVTISYGNGTSLTLEGSPVQVALTIPTQAPDSQQAVELAIYLISPGGTKALSALGVTPLSPAVLYGNLSAVPAPLSFLLNSPMLQYGGTLG